MYIQCVYANYSFSHSAGGKGNSNRRYTQCLPKQSKGVSAKTSDSVGFVLGSNFAYLQ